MSPAAIAFSRIGQPLLLAWLALVAALKTVRFSADRRVSHLESAIPDSERRPIVAARRQHPLRPRKFKNQLLTSQGRMLAQCLHGSCCQGRSRGR